MEPNNLVRNISIGDVIKDVMKRKNLNEEDIKIRFKCSTRTFNKMLESKSLDTMLLLKWSKLLRYDFFRLYSSHLMLHHGISNTITKKVNHVELEGIHIRKNVYTKELIQFLVNKVRSNEMNSGQVIAKYGIPKTTFYKWLQKYPKN
jgi:hypothetical protein